MTDTSCAFLLTKLSNLPLYFFPFFHMFNYDAIDSGYYETSGYVGGLDPGGA
jgi:hypothetical protein